MQRLRKFYPWLLPLLGIAFGYIWAYIEYHGLAVTWQRIGNPGQSVVHILGIKDGNRLLVSTAKDSLYSFRFFEDEKVHIFRPVDWQPEQTSTVDKITSIRYYGADFYPLPPLFKVQHLYKLVYIYHIEGKGEIQFAVDPDGNLWVWSHAISGMTGLIFILYPVFGFLLGVLLAVVIAGSRWLRAFPHRSHQLRS